MNTHHPPTPTPHSMTPLTSSRASLAACSVASIWSFMSDLSCAQQNMVGGDNF